MHMAHVRSKCSVAWSRCPDIKPGPLARLLNKQVDRVKMVTQPDGTKVKVPIKTKVSKGLECMTVIHDDLAWKDEDLSLLEDAARARNACLHLSGGPTGSFNPMYNPLFEGLFGGPIPGLDDDEGTQPNPNAGGAAGANGVHGAGARNAPNAAHATGHAAAAHAQDTRGTAGPAPGAGNHGAAAGPNGGTTARPPAPATGNIPPMGAGTSTTAPRETRPVTGAANPPGQPSAAAADPAQPPRAAAAGGTAFSEGALYLSPLGLSLLSAFSNALPPGAARRAT